mmetsp:Transcript_17876/g.54971  ORF Transcript_17876/g.54971 Transcript_17876/m.54971 type:complete len:273 (-) Transcript_17876:844-1662(-)
MLGEKQSATSQFFHNSLSEPSLSRTHKTVEQGVKTTEKILNKRILRSAKLLCYHASELLASHRCDYSKNSDELDYQHYKKLVVETEKLVLSIEIAVSELQFARRALSRLFQWLKCHPATVTDKKGNQSNIDEISTRKLRAHELYDMIKSLEVATPKDCAPLQYETESLLNLAVSRLLSNSDSNAKSDLARAPEYESSQVMDISGQITTILKTIERGTKLPPDEAHLKLSQYSHFSCAWASNRDDWCNAQNLIFGTRLRAAITSELTYVSRPT